jgi:hypothetical protein
MMFPLSRVIQRVCLDKEYKSVLAPKEEMIATHSRGKSSRGGKGSGKEVVVGSGKEGMNDIMFSMKCYIRAGRLEVMKVIRV